LFLTLPEQRSFHGGSGIFFVADKLSLQHYSDLLPRPDDNRADVSRPPGCWSDMDFFHDAYTLIFTLAT
jgi:hypothetical protein